MRKTSDGSTDLLRVTYTYDVGGRRAKRQEWESGVGSSEERYAYDGQHVWADLDNANAVTARYLYRPGTDQIESRWVASGANSGRAFYLTDRLGSVRDLVDWSETVQDHINYDGFGVVTHTNSGYADRYLFTGREYDDKTGLQYNRARYYDSATGRWLSEDPIRFEAEDANLYRYVGNNPLNITDPLGLVAFFFDGAGQTEKTRSIIFRMFEASNDPHKHYVESPIFWKNFKQFQGQARDAAQTTLKECLETFKKEKTFERIDLIGWSRGGALAIATANEIATLFKNEKLPTEITFMGLIDPVSTGLIGAPNLIPAIVKIFWLGVRDKSKDPNPTSFLFPIMTIVVADKGKTTVIPKFYPLKHEETGFDPTVAKDLYTAAKNAGMDLKPLKP